MTRLLLADVLPLEDPAAYAFLYGMTSSERKRTADSFRFMKDRMLSVGASALLDAGLREFGLRERDMTYGRSEHGKPFFLNAPDIHFNISHSASKVAVALSDREVGCDIEEAFAAGLSAQSAEKEAAAFSSGDVKKAFAGGLSAHSVEQEAVAFSDREVGCDIEEAFAAALSAQSVEQEAAAFSSGDVKEAFAAGLSAQSVEQEAAKCLEMAGRFFSREEYLAVKAAESPSECIRTFYRCWTLKESYMKATGLGLSLAPDSFSVAALCTGGSGSLLRHTGCLDCLSHKVADGFVFYTVDSFEGYECALCCRPEACVPEVMLVRLGER